MSDPIKPKIYELDRCTLFAPVENNQRASMVFALREGYPRLTVFTRTQSDKDGKGVISAAFDIEHFLILLSRLEAIARQPNELKEKANVKHFPRDDAGKIKGDREVTAEVFYGKNATGVMWLSVQQPNRPKIVFEITLSDFHEFFNSKGEPLNIAEGSVLRTLALTSLLRYHFTHHSLTMRDTSIPRPTSVPYSQRSKSANNHSAAPAGAGAFDPDDDIGF